MLWKSKIRKCYWFWQPISLQPPQETVDMFFVDPGIMVTTIYPGNCYQSSARFLGIFCLSTRQCAERETPPDLWPPNSPDLNPVDHKIYICRSYYQTLMGILFWDMTILIILVNCVVTHVCLSVRPIVYSFYVYSSASFCFTVCLSTRLSLYVCVYCQYIVCSVLCPSVCHVHVKNMTKTRLSLKSPNCPIVALIEENN